MNEAVAKLLLALAVGGLVVSWSLGSILPIVIVTGVSFMLIQVARIFD